VELYFRRWYTVIQHRHKIITNQCLLEAGEAWWLSLAADTWPWFVPAPLFVPYMSRLSQQPSQKISKETGKWMLSLDVAHFSPTEIFLSVKDGFLVVEGKHEERRDEHRFIARSFTRKYRLAGEIVTADITATLSADGILTVEAPIQEESVPTVTVIPIKVDKKTDSNNHKQHFFIFI
uniref:SHSP domain-containing protein n=1 Tax=Cynoglossus semilaevis TaxID=244447 RepID=A0A3P8VCD3_CYNSE